MLQQLVIYTGIWLVLSSAILFIIGGQLRRSHWLGSLLLNALISSGAWALQSGLVGTTLSLSLNMTVALALGVTVTALFEDWDATGHAAFTAIVGTAAVFLAYVCYVIFGANLGPWSLAFALLLLLLQVGALVLLVANMFEVIDVLCRVRWTRLKKHKIIPGYQPKVSLHVPIHAEPPELVIDTLDALARLDYANYEVLVIDNNTADESLWKPVEEHCAKLGKRFRFFHLIPWPGYKSGALNFALKQTVDDTEIVGVVDADYVVAPRFLADLVGHFADERTAFVQTPQDYRDHVSRGRYGRALYLAYLYFFEVSMASRNEYNGIIYAGTMGLIRRSALETVGGWDEWCVTEDAEISLRLLNAGFQSVYVPQTYGRGIMPLDYAGLKKQRFRWAFGGMQILRKHAGLLFNPQSVGKLTWSQRIAYVNGGLQWLNDPMALAFSVILLLGSGALLLGESFQSQPLAGAATLMPPLFILFAVMRFIWAFRLRTKCTIGEAVDALTILLGLTWVVAIACIRGLVSKEGVFLRTPKQAERPTLLDAVRIVWVELLFGMTCFAAAAALFVTQRENIVSALGIVVLMLLWQAAVYFAAVRSSSWSYAEAMPQAQRTWFKSFHNLGHRVGKFISEPRAVATLVLLLIFITGLFYIGRRNAPLMERVRSADPLRQFLPANSIVQSSDPVVQVAAALMREADAAERQDINAALRLWAPDGVIVDADFRSTPNAEDRSWTGMEQLRERYIREFQERRYESLRHLNLSVQINGNEAIVTNDLMAVFETDNVLRRLHLPGSDRWVFRKDGNAWRIVRLEVNRTAFTDLSVSAGEER
jgi:cellulose synthase/poly-beta-1,6-N-acetylglucosamine synthase-like glycosyltransferase